MLCPECLQLIDDNVDFCGYCGKKNNVKKSCQKYQSELFKNSEFDTIPKPNLSFNVNDFIKMKYEATSISTEAKCPNCGSQSIQAVNKGFSAGQAIAGAALLGPVGLAAGAIGSNNTKRVCLKCGHKW